MEIQALKLLITEAEVNTIATRHLPADVGVRDLAVRFTPQGIVVRGKYHMVMTMPFETLWQVSVNGGHLAAQLADVKVVGFPAAMLKGVLIGIIRDALNAGDAARVDGESLRIDPDRLLAEHGFPARTNLTAVRCEEGRLFIESTLPAAP
jgi:hypothetical protein